MTIDIEPLRKQIGRKIEDEDVVTEAPLKAMIATFDRPDKVPAAGEPIAPGWHLCFLHSYARRASLGKDGAAADGGVLPRIPMPRRMYAGSTFIFDGDIRVGDKLRRELEFTDIQLRQGGHRHADRHDPDPPYLYAARSRAHRGRQHGVPR
jgi:3-methylfumaryl-CoA hydratase